MGTEENCPSCGVALASLEIAGCPGCGKNFGTGPALSPAGPSRTFVGRYLADLALILTHPSRFFARLREKERFGTADGLAAALAFAIVTHWIGQSLKFFWQAALSGTINERFKPAFRVFSDLAEVDHPGQSEMLNQARDRLVHWMWGAGSVIADPFITLVQILFTSFLVFIGARILISPGRGGAPEEIRYETALKIVCYGMTPAILAAIPFAGPFIATICVWIVTTIGVHETYRSGWGRSIVVALFPKVLFVGIVGFGLFFVGIMFFKLVASVL